jgi:quercetin 2,3-dioxygenase
VPLRPDFEYGLSVLSGAALIGGEPVPPAMFAYLGAGRSEISINLAAGSRILLLGGEPFGQEIAMWWNFVARNRDELEEAYRDWTAQDERFGKVASTLERIPAPRPFWMDRSG